MCVNTYKIAHTTCTHMVSVPKQSMLSLTVFSKSWVISECKCDFMVKCNQNERLEFLLCFNCFHKS